VDQVATFEDGGDRSARIGERLRTWPPPAVAALFAVIGSVVLTLLLVGLGLVITHSVLAGPIGAWDSSWDRWFELHRTTTLNGWTNTGSTLAGTGTILLVAGLSVAILLIRRLWYEAGYLLVGLFIEITVFLGTTTLVDRPRPTIQPLDHLPLTSSFPSGHVAAAIVLYVGLAIILSSHTHPGVVRLSIWTVALLIPIWVGLSRVYRGMHHPSDVAASVLLGIGALLFSRLAVRSAAATAEARMHRAPPVREPLPEVSEAAG
jgi:membrane-associated phospholipid phosphatase